MIRFPSSRGPLCVSSEKQIAIYDLWSLFAEEYRLVQEQGVEALLERFNMNRVSDINLFYRKNVAL